MLFLVVCTIILFLHAISDLFSVDVTVDGLPKIVREYLPIGVHVFVVISLLLYCLFFTLDRPSESPAVSSLTSSYSVTHRTLNLTNKPVREDTSALVTRSHGQSTICPVCDVGSAYDMPAEP